MVELFAVVAETDEAALVVGQLFAAMAPVQYVAGRAEVLVATL